MARFNRWQDFFGMAKLAKSCEVDPGKILTYNLTKRIGEDYGY